MLQNRHLVQFTRACFSCFSHLKAIFFLTLILTIFLHASDIYSAQVTLGWEPNAENDLAGYKIHYGKSSRNYDSHVDVGDQTSYTLSGLASGDTYFLTATAYDFSGNESAYSEEVNIYFNTPPVLSPVGDKSAGEGKPLNFTLSATDPDGDTLNYTLSNLPAGAGFDSNTGAFSWTPSYQQAGEYPVTFEASDGKDTDSEDIIITVVNTNRPPELDPIGDITVNEGDTVTLNPAAADPDGDSLTFTYSGWMTSNTYTTKYDDAGEHAVTVAVSDGQSTVSQDVKIRVVNTNRPPVLDLMAPINVNEGVTIILNPLATDPDGDSLTFAYTGWMTSNAYTTKYDDSGGHTVTVAVSDGKLKDSQDVKINVLNTNRPPVLDPIADVTVNEGETVTLHAAAVDLDEDTLTFTYSGWMTSNAYTTKYGDAGEHTVTVTVSDGELTDSLDIKVTVVENSLLGYWKLDEGSGAIAVDSSGSGNDGTIYGGAAWSTGRSGSGLSFDGIDDYADAGDIDLNGAFTISAWINISSMNKNTILGKSYSTYQFYVSPNGRLVFQRNSGTRIDFNAELETETWYHVAVTFDTTHGMVMYLDGSSVDTCSDTSIATESKAATKVGATGWTAKNFFHGTLDEVRLYTRALSAKEILGLYRQCTVIVPLADSNINVDENLNESH